MSSMPHIILLFNNRRGSPHDRNRLRLTHVSHPRGAAREPWNNAPVQQNGPEDHQDDDQDHVHPEGQGQGQQQPEVENPRLFTRDFLLATAVNLGLAMVFYMLITGLAVYAASQFGAGETAAGFAASAFVVGALIARIFAGKYVNFLGRRRTLWTCLIVYVLASLGYIWADSYELLIALRVFHGMAFGFGQTALTTAVFDLIPVSRRGEGSGYFMLANALPPAAGPLLSIQLTDLYGFWAMFVGATAVSAVALAAALFIRLPERRPEGGRIRDHLRLRPSDILDRRAVTPALVMMLLGATFGSVLTFLNGYARSIEMVDAASAYFVVYAVAVLVSRFFAGRIQDRRGDNVVVYPAILLYTASLVLLAWAPSPAVVVLSGVLAGLGFGSILPVLQAVVAAAVPPHRVSIAVSTFFILMDSGFGLSPLLLGPMVELWGYRPMYWICAAVVAGTLALYWALHGRHDVRQGTARRPRRS